MVASVPKNRIIREVELAARVHTTLAIDTLARIARETDYEKVPAAAQVSASNALLDRGWGKPQQTVVVDAGDVGVMQTEDLERHVTQRLAQLHAAAAAVGQGGPTPGRDDTGAAEAQGQELTPRVVH